MKIAYVIIIAIVLILIIGVVLYIATSKPNWNGNYSSVMNPGQTFTITENGPVANISDGTVATISGSTIIAYGTSGTISGDKINWKNGNVWTKIS